jgi:hypothetical protein
MFVLDTNILSAMMRLGRVPEVAAWIARQDEDRLFTSAISHAEIFAGLAIMPDGRRRRELENTARAMFEEFEGRVLAFDKEAAHEYAGRNVYPQFVGLNHKPITRRSSPEQPNETLKEADRVREPLCCGRRRCEGAR